MKISKTKPWLRDEAHGNWKGDKAGYVARHAWVKVRLGTPTRCAKCKKSGGSTFGYHWSNISGEYRRELSDWQRLCMKCHAEYDKWWINGVRNRKAKYDFVISQITRYGKPVKDHISIADASRETGISQTAIANALSGLSKSAGGYKWMRVPK